MNLTTLANVFIWDSFVGTVAWASDMHVAFFEYSDNIKKQNLELAPLMMPISRQQIYSFSGLSEETFQGLPGLLADSLPDYFGNAVINAFLRAQGRPENSFDPVALLYREARHGRIGIQAGPVTGEEIAETQCQRAFAAGHRDYAETGIVQSFSG